MAKKTFQVEVVNFKGDNVKKKYIGCNSLEEAYLTYTKLSNGVILIGLPC